MTKKIKTKIIFLDIDGVLAGYDYLMKGKGFIDAEKIQLINQLEGAEIVISSSWGNDNGKTEKTLRQCGLTLPIIGYTEHYYQDWLCRGNEIEKWLVDNCTIHTKFGTNYTTNYTYVIVDDDSDMLLGQKDNFVHINRETGITKEDIERIKEILTINH